MKRRVFFQVSWQEGEDKITLTFTDKRQADDKYRNKRMEARHDSQIREVDMVMVNRAREGYAGFYR
jgi:hypothetical protein